MDVIKFIIKDNGVVSKEKNSFYRFPVKHIDGR